LNQNLRSSLDLLGIDVRQAGERLPGDFPAIEIVDGGTGPDRLILRRNLVDEVLPLCAALQEGVVDDEVAVASGDPDPPPGCDPVPDDDADGWPDNVGAWRAYRAANGAEVPAYVFNPVDGVGEWFVFDGDGATNLLLHKGNDDAWAADYDVDEQCRLYLLEQREYRLDSGLLQLLQTQDGEPVHVAAQLLDFQVRAIDEDGAVLESLSVDDAWKQLRAIEVTVIAQGGAASGAMERSLTVRFFPRNAMSG
jgi:type IV pilus assembly protein PilW